MQLTTILPDHSQPRHDSGQGTHRDAPRDHCRVRGELRPLPKVSATVGMTSFELWWSEAAGCGEDHGRACVRGLYSGVDGLRFLGLERALHWVLLHGRARR
jgi:hypothetical protein